MEYANEQTTLSNLAQIEKTLVDDVSGNSVREIIEYYEKTIQACTAQNTVETHGSNWQPESQIIDGMRASQRILKKAWDSQHSKTLDL